MQKIIGAKNWQKDTVSAVKNSGAKKAFIVASKRTLALPAAEELVLSLNEAGVFTLTYSDFTVNPKYEEVYAATRLFIKENCDFVIAIGGGSAMDVAKCVKLYAKMPYDSDFIFNEIKENSVPFLAVPTTAGTGSEATHFAVIYSKGEKQSVLHKSAVPGYVVFVPEFLRTLPDYQKKATMLDALCHAVEAYWSKNRCAESSAYAKEAIELIFKEKDEYLKNTDEGNEKMLLAANLAGKAINITQTTAAHAMCYKLTTLYGIAHGHAAGIILPKLWKVMLASKDITPELSETFLQLANIMGQKNAYLASQEIETLLDELDMNKHVVKREDLELLTSKVNVDRLENNPVIPSKEEIRSIYESLI